MNVEVLCSTDDPTDDLEYHERAVDEVERIDVLPTWRADRAVHIDSAEWIEFVDELGDATGIDARDFDGFREALRASQQYFAERGCRASDLSMREPISRAVSDDRARAVFEKKLDGQSLDPDEIRDFKAYLLEYVGESNTERDWVTQIHFGPLRNYRDELYETLGPASGGTVSTQDVDPAKGLDHFVNRFDGELDVVLYCLDPTHYPTIATMARAFPRVSVGPAWWFNDSPFGIEHQLEYVGTVDLLANHAGMVSDSRKVMSYGSRFEMFRRSLANVLGGHVERGQMPMAVAADLAEHLAYDRPNELYGFR